MSKHRSSGRQPDPLTDGLSPSKEPEYESIVGLGTRALGLGCGPITLILLLIGMVQYAGWLTLRDFAYFCVLGLLPLVRWLEFRNGKARTSDGRLLTFPDLQKYALVVVVGGLLAWVTAKVVGNVLVAR